MLLQIDESVREGYWIYRPPGDTGRSLNDDKSTCYLVWMWWWHIVWGFFPIKQQQTHSEFVLLQHRRLQLRISLHFQFCKITLASLMGMNHYIGAYVLEWYIRSKGSTPTQDETIMLYLSGKGLLSSLSFMSDAVTSSRKQKPNLIGRVV